MRRWRIPPRCDRYRDRSIRLQGGLDGTQRQKLPGIAEKCPIHRLPTGEVGIATSSDGE